MKITIEELNVTPGKIAVDFATDDAGSLALLVLGLAAGTHAIVDARTEALDAVRVPAPAAKPAAEVVDDPPPVRASKRKPAPEPEPEPEEEDDEPEEEEEDDEPPAPKARAGKIAITAEVKEMKFRDLIAHVIGLGVTSKKEIIKQVEALIDVVPSVTKIAAKEGANFSKRVAATADFVDQNLKP